MIDGVEGCRRCPESEERRRSFVTLEGGLIKCFVLRGSQIEWIQNSYRR